MRASSEAFLVRDSKEEDQWAARLGASTRMAKTKTEWPSTNWESMGIAPEMVKSGSYFGQRSMGEGEFYVLEANELFLQNRSMSHGSMILKLKLISQCLLDVSLFCGILLPWPCEVTRCDTLSSNSFFVNSFWPYGLIACYEVRVVLVGLIYASWWFWNMRKTLVSVQNDCCCWFVLLVLFEIVLAIVFSKVIWSFSLFSFQDKDISGFIGNSFVCFASIFIEGNVQKFSFFHESMFLLEFVALCCNLTSLDDLRSFVMGLWPLWLGFMPLNPNNFFFCLFVSPLEGWLTCAHLCLPGFVIVLVCSFKCIKGACSWIDFSSSPLLSHGLFSGATIGVNQICLFSAAAIGVIHSMHS